MQWLAKDMQAKSESFRSLVSVPLTTMIGISLVSERAADTEPILDEIFLSLTRPYGVGLPEAPQE